MTVTTIKIMIVDPNKNSGVVPPWLRNNNIPHIMGENKLDGCLQYPVEKQICTKTSFGS